MKMTVTVGMLWSTLVGIGFLSSAQARTVDLGLIDDGLMRSNYGHSSNAAFAETAAFGMNELSDVGGQFFSADLPASHRRGLPFRDAGTGIYHHVLNVAKAPEAETSLMIVIGLGLVVFQLRRTQRLLQHRPLAG